MLVLTSLLNPRKCNIIKGLRTNLVSFVKLPVLPAFDNLFFTRLIRRERIDIAVPYLQGLFVIATLYFAIITGIEFIDNVLGASHDIVDFNNQINERELILVNEPIGSTKKIKFEQIAEHPLLGPLTTPTMAASRPTVVQAAANTPINLLGTFITPGQAPYAILEDAKKNIQDAFNVGETVFGEAKLVKVLSDRVHIDRKGQIEELVLDDLFKSGPGGRDSTGSEIIVSAEDIDRALENLPLLVTQARAVPYFKDGKSVGLRLFAIKNDSLFEKIGLKNADIIKTINGNNLGDITQAIKLFEMLKQEKRLSLALERNGEEKEFRYEIR